MSPSHAPVFLREPQSSLISAVNTRERAAARGTASGKGIRALAREGKEEDLRFSLYEQRGATTTAYIYGVQWLH